MDHRDTRAPEPVAIVVLNLNGKAKTLRCLSSVAEIDYSPYEVVLVDNGSTDGSVEAIAQEFPHIHVVRNSCNLGAAGGRNRGIAYANKHFPYGYLLFLDNDAWLERSALRELVRVMQSDPQVGLASSKIYQAGAPMVLASAGGHRINWYTGTIRTVGAGEVDLGQYDGNRPITCSGSGVLVRRAVFERIGGLDEAFNPYGWEDLDFSLRARAAGFGIRFVPTAITHHEGGKAGRGRALPEYEESKTKNFFLIMKRHATRMQWACVLCVFPIRAAWRTVGELCSGRWDVVLAHGRGFVRVLRKSAPHSGDSGPATRTVRDSTMTKEPGVHHTQMPVVSVVVPCRGQAEALRQCLRQLQRQRVMWPVEIMVIDSAEDQAVAAVAAEFSGIRLISDPSGLFPGAARNLGAQHARGEYLAFTDADCVPDPDWLAAAVSVLESGAVVVGGAVLDVRAWHLIAAADNLLQFSDFSPQRPDGPISHIPSANFAIRRTAFAELGGFTGAWPLGEDGLFSTAAAARWPDGIRFVRNMRVRHAGRTTLRAFWQHQDTFGFYRGRLGSRLRRPAYQRWGRWRIFAVPIIGMRLSHLIRQTARWNPVGLLRLLVLLPVILLGLSVWVNGFRRGCREAAGQPT